MSIHPETPDGTTAVFYLETSNFIQGQGNPPIDAENA
jgi:hypothetical protein